MYDVMCSVLNISVASVDNDNKNNGNRKNLNGIHCMFVEFST